MSWRVQLQRSGPQQGGACDWESLFNGKLNKKQCRKMEQYNASSYTPLGKKVTTEHYEINDPRIPLLLTVSHSFHYSLFPWAILLFCSPPFKRHLKQNRMTPIAVAEETVGR